MEKERLRKDLAHQASLERCYLLLRLHEEERVPVPTLARLQGVSRTRIYQLIARAKEEKEVG